MNEINNEIKGRTIGYISTAFGLVAGLAWNEAISSFINVLFPVAKNSVWIKFGYAIVLTIVVVLVVRQLNHFLNQATK